MNATAAEEAYEQKVFRTFVVDGRLTAIPAQRKKRDVILRHLVDFFDRERVYPEPEVNAVIGGFHEDFATLRRELVDCGLLVRFGVNTLGRSSNPAAAAQKVTEART